MAKHQLTLSPTYVKDWTYLQAARELFQNALDNQTTSPENEMFISYEDEVLQIGNKTSILTLDTLLLGSSSKRDDENTIGKHGEGYKVALMVFLREGKQVTIYNYGAREIWNTRLVKSRKFNGALITEVDVSKKAFFKNVPSHNLIIEVKGITADEYQTIIDNTLHLQDDVPKYETSSGMGSILTDESQKGKVYVNGLYITTNSKFSYGYDIKPKYINLDRDRKLVDTFELSWVTSKMWRQVCKEDLVASMLMSDTIDVKYIKSNKSYSEEEEVDNKIAEALHTKFVESHGSSSIPVSSNTDLQRVSKSSVAVKPVMVSQAVTEYLKDEIEMPEELSLTLYDRFSMWFEDVKGKLSDEEIAEFEILLDEM